jgi:hypothetical protein
MMDYNYLKKAHDQGMFVEVNTICLGGRHSSPPKVGAMVFHQSHPEYGEGLLFPEGSFMKPGEDTHTLNEDADCCQTRIRILTQSEKDLYTSPKLSTCSDDDLLKELAKRYKVTYQIGPNLIISDEFTNLGSVFLKR